jgi:phosphate transport system substrate-binding protein
MNLKWGLGAVAVLLFLFACQRPNGKAKSKLSTPSSGEVAIIADASLKPLLNEQIKLFELTYPEASIQVTYTEQQEVARGFIEDTIPVAILARPLTQEEKDYFITRQLVFQEMKMATDAIVFVVNKENADTNLTYQQIQQILSGELTTWKQAGSSSNGDSIVIVFDQRRSGIVQTLQEKFLNGAPLAANAFAADSEAAVIRYVQQNAPALGVISVNWISDKEAETTQRFSSLINIVSISSADSAENEIYYAPTRHHMLYSKYPFLRDVYVLLREGHIGLGTGFANYLMREEGQLIIHRFGLVAFRQPIRVIELKNEF